MENGHVSALQAKHHELEALIRDELLRPQPDSMRLLRWKKEKLRLKQELVSH